MVIALIALVVAIGGTAYATGEGNPILGGARNPGSDTSKSLTRETQIIANTSGYGTRQSNKSSSGGGAVYGCRSGAGGTATGNEPCVRGNNLSVGRAFEFATAGSEAGRIDTKDASGRPFTTNATGVATGLNADRVDSLDADQIVANARAGLNPLKTFAVTGTSSTSSDLTAARAGASEIVLLQSGAFTVYAKCFVDSDAAPDGSAEVIAEVYARTTQDGSMLDGQVDSVLLDGDPAFLNTGTEEADRRVASRRANSDATDDALPTGVRQVNLDLDDDISALVGPDGTAVEFHAVLGAKTGALASNGLWGEGNRCGFGISRFG
jgi:hypothetical protein